MSALSKVATNFLGTSWKSSLAGILEGSAQALLMYFMQNAFPGMSDQNKLTLWIAGGLSVVLTVVRGYMSKDHNVSNSPGPIAPATVPVEQLTVPNPNAKS